MTRNPGGDRRLRRVGEAALWLIVIAAALIGALTLLAELRLVVLPVLLALVLATFLMPPTHWLSRRGSPRGLAALAVVAVTLAAVALSFAFLVPPVVSQFAQIDFQVSGGVDRLQSMIRASPLPVSTEQMSQVIDNLQDRVGESFAVLARRVLSGAVVAVEIMAGLLLAVAVLLFLLKDGEPMWAWLVSLTPPARREDVDAIGRRSWEALGGFIRGQSVVALFDAVLIGLALALIGVRLALPPRGARLLRGVRPGHRCSGHRFARRARGARRGGGRRSGRRLRRRDRRRPRARGTGPSHRRSPPRHRRRPRSCLSRTGFAASRTSLW